MGPLVHMRIYLFVYVWVLSRSWCKDSKAESQHVCRAEELIHMKDGCHILTLNTLQVSRACWADLIKKSSGSEFMLT